MQLSAPLGTPAVFGPQELEPEPALIWKPGNALRTGVPPQEQFIEADVERFCTCTKVCAAPAARQAVEDVPTVQPGKWRPAGALPAFVTATAFDGVVPGPNGPVIAPPPPPLELPHEATDRLAPGIASKLILIVPPFPAVETRTRMSVKAAVSTRARRHPRSSWKKALPDKLQQPH